ncbi:hypothetical protein MUK42_29795 [Musa troglodytarum]|uniref:Uncharacterized protein n=1 Tax=Musa troglodytarum TaxID=320322 RepID=A0A9E7KC72_9LILI|nr:hypothetical protein MUK42_29795 [Musa troglodytarum]
MVWVLISDQSTMGPSGPDSKPYRGEVHDERESILRRRVKSHHSVGSWLAVPLRPRWAGKD